MTLQYNKNIFKALKKVQFSKTVDISRIVKTTTFWTMQ